MKCNKTDKVSNKKYILLVISIMIVVVIMKLLTNDGILIDQSGEVFAVKKPENSKIYNFKLEIIQGEKRINKDIEIKLKNEKNSQRQGQMRLHEKDNLETFIDDMIRRLQAEQGEVIYLPKNITNDIQLRWKKNLDIPWMLIFLPLIIWLSMKFDKKIKDEKKIKEKKNQILDELPLFINEIVLLLNCGLIFKDVFYQIGDEYEEKLNPNYFQLSLINIIKESEKKKTNEIVDFNEFGRKSGVRELARTSNVILDSHYRGTDLVDKLDSERRKIWDDKKNRFKERGRLAETKLTFPLAALLIVLIVITISPSMMQL